VRLSKMGRSVTLAERRHRSPEKSYRDSEGEGPGGGGLPNEPLQTTRIRTENPIVRSSSDERECQRRESDQIRLLGAGKEERGRHRTELIFKSWEDERGIPEIR